LINDLAEEDSHFLKDRIHKLETNFEKLLNITADQQLKLNQYRNGGNNQTMMESPRRSDMAASFINRAQEREAYLSDDGHDPNQNDRLRRSHLKKVKTKRRTITPNTNGAKSKGDRSQRGHSRK
jgi:hypothetical protein